MEGFWILLAVGALIVPFVLPIVAMARTRRIVELDEHLRALADRLDALTQQNARLHTELATLRAAPPPEPPAPEATALAALDALAQDARLEAGLAVPAAEPQPEPGPEESKTEPVDPQPVPPVIEQPPPKPAKPPIDWEQWLGVRGAAALGGIVLALAGLLFFQYSVQRGLISPALRVVLGTLAGMGCLVGSTRLRKYGGASNALAGGGAVVLYAAFFAARSLYQLIPMELAFALMALVTAVTALFAVRFDSLFIAALGLAGGFLTPLVLSTGANRPFGLFGYLLMLDIGFLVVAYRRRWPGLALFALAGTLAIEALWIGKKMEAGQLAIALGAVGLFAVLFLASGARAARKEPATRMLLVTQATAVILPHGFALYFAVDAGFGYHLYPIALLLTLLQIAAFYIAANMPPDEQGNRLDFLPTATAAGTLAVVAVWLGKVHLSTPRAWETILCLVLLSLPAVIVAWRRPPGRPLQIASALYPGGLFIVLLAASLGGNLHEPWAFETGLVVLSAMVLTLARDDHAAVLAAIAPAFLGAALELLATVHGDAKAFGSTSAYQLVELLLFLCMIAYAFWFGRRRSHLGDRAAEGAILLGAITLLGQAFWSRAMAEPAGFVFGSSLAWALLIALAVVLRSDGRWMFAALIPVVAVHYACGFQLLHAPERVPVVVLADCVLGVVLFTRAPFFAWPRLRGRSVFYVAALAGFAWLPLTLKLYRDHFGVIGQGAVPLVFAAISLTTIPSVRGGFAPSHRARRSALVWIAAAALGMLSIAIPVELDRQWITIAYALEAAAVLALWKRLDHAGLKYFAFGLTVAVGVRLVANPSVLLYANRGSIPILNWVLYTYWVPAIALLVGSRILEGLEVSRLRRWEQSFYQRPGARPPSPILSMFMGLVVIALLFAWINLAIADWFGTGDSLTLDYARRPARDLTTSIAWALYAVVLLSLGVWRKSSGLRWVSLAVMLVTIGKVFLYDLGELKDLYRVVSLLGLAISLIGVSLAYQHFVFRKSDAPAASETPA